MNNEIYDVIIIGCGSSGIAAAIQFEKSQSKLSYLILEGRNRIGGRAFTDLQTFGENIPVDIGAHYLCHHQNDNFLWKNYIQSDKDFIESDIYQKNLMKIFDSNGNIISDDLIDQSMKYVDQLLLFIQEYSNENIDLSIFDLINSKIENISNEQMKNVVKHFLSCIELHEGSDLNQLSTRFYQQGEGQLEESDLSIHHGLGRFIKEIASKYNLPIKFNSIVNQINILNNLVEIKTNENCCCSYLCKYVLITIPLGCLKSNSIEFNPSLPQWKKESIEKMGFSLLNKIYLQFSEIFWEENLRRINVIDNQFQFYYCLPEFHMLALYVSGSFAKQLEEKTDQQIVEEIFDSLRKIYPQITYPIKWLITRWNQDPFAQGSYSSFHLGSHSEILKQLAEETHDGHVHWAGEHTNYNGCIGYVDSGFETGFREAKAIINKLDI